MPRASRVTESAPSRPPYMSVPVGWDATWRAALAASGTTPATIAFIGHSFTQGFIASDYVSLGYAGRLVTALKAAYGARGDFWCSTDCQHWLALNGATYTWGGTPPWTLAGTVTYLFGFGYSKTPFWGVSATTNLATFVAPYACTALDIVHYDHTAGTFEYRVDGGSPTTVTCTGVGQRRRIGLTGLSNATHTLTFGNTSAANVMGLIGVATYQGAAGVAAARLAVGYGSAANLTTSAQGNAANTVGQTFGYQAIAGYPGPAVATATFGFPSGAHLAVIEHGLNDSSPFTLLLDNLGLIISAVRRAQPGASILLVGSPYPSAISDVTPTLAISTHSQILGASAQAALAHGAAFVSMQAKWGSTPFAQGFTGSTNQHPIDAGHADIAAVLSPLIL